MADPQHRAGHPAIALREKVPERGTVTLPRLAQHPSDGLVDQVVSVPEQEVSYPERLVQLAAPDELMGRDDGDAPLPQRRRSREPRQRRTAAVREPAADDGPGGGVDEIPVVDVARVSEVRLVDSFAGPCRPTSGTPGRAGAARVPALREPAIGAASDRGERCAAAFAADSSHIGNADADESVTLAVLPGACLEEALEEDGILRRGVGVERFSECRDSGRRRASLFSTCCHPLVPFRSVRVKPGSLIFRRILSSRRPTA